jgi:hypothetical protein
VSPLEKTVPKENIENQPVNSPKPEYKKSGSGKTSVKKNKAAKPLFRKRKKIIAKKAPEKASAGGSKLLSRKAIMDIINTMRAEGSTFDQVALHLVELGQPTFSGRGEWHAQTIHRLCNKR